MKTSPSLAFFLSALVLAAASPVLRASYSITDLGQGSASDLNDAGSVVGVNAQNGGWYYHGGTQSALTNVVVADPQGPGGEHNYVYTETFASLRINNVEQIAGVGFWPAVPDNVLSFLYVPQGGGGTGVTYPGVGTGATGYGGSLALSDSGLAALSYFVNVPPLGSFSAAAQVIVPSANGGNFDLGFPYEKINAINSSGVMVGSLALGPASFPGQKATYVYPARACIVENYVVQFLDTRNPGTNDIQCCGTPDHLSDALAINSRGHVVGEMTATVPGGTNHGFIYRGNGLEQLETFGYASSATDLNDADQIVGNAKTADGSTKPFLWVHGVATDLNTFLPAESGWVLTKANGINNKGQIVGEGRYQGSTHAFLLTPPAPTGYTIVDFGPGSAMDINDHGSAVGVLSGRTNPAAYYHNGSVEVLPLFKTWLYSAFSLKINNSEHIAGIRSDAFDPHNNSYLYYPETGQVETNNSISGAIFWAYGYVGGIALNNHDLHPTSYLHQKSIFDGYNAAGIVFAPMADGGYTNLPWPYQNVKAINDSGTMAGSVGEGVPPMLPPNAVLSHPARACVISNNVALYIDPRPAGDKFVENLTVNEHLSDAYGINAQGNVVGDMSPDIPGPIKHAFLYRGRDLEDLGTLGGTSSTALDINDFDRVVGTSTRADGTSRAFLWESGTMIDLNSVLPPDTDWVLTQANAINNQGQIVGDGLYLGQRHGFVLSPHTLGYSPTITAQPLGKDLSIHDAYTLTVTATGQGPFSYQWQKGTNDLSGQTNSTFQLPDAVATDAGSYRVIVSNAMGGTPSSTAQVNVLDPKLSASTGDGGSLTLMIRGEATGNYRLEYATSLSGTPVWTPLTSLTLTNATQIYTTSVDSSPAPRFYRGIRLP